MKNLPLRKGVAENSIQMQHENTVAAQPYSSALGEGVKSKIKGQLVCGNYNADNGYAKFIVGRGTGDSDSERGNSFAAGVDTSVTGSPSTIWVGTNKLTAGQVGTLATMANKEKSYLKKSTTDYILYDENNPIPAGLYTFKVTGSDFDTRRTCTSFIMELSEPCRSPAFNIQLDANDENKYNHARCTLFVNFRNDSSGNGYKAVLCETYHYFYSDETYPAGAYTLRSSIDTYDFVSNDLYSNVLKLYYKPLFV